ncbi:MAG: transcription termination/antitermination protein NusG [Methylacidiphilales bacterium]|nr:transcription termination/antitermination protein NusG [Candidatus Methylacidiphilales bacterium]
MTDQQIEMKWYIVQAYSGNEQKAVVTLKERIARLNMTQFFGEILVPTENVIEIKSGQKRKVERRLYPGYIFIQMALTSESWHLIRHTPNLLGFIGGRGDQPEPIADNDINSIRGQIEEGVNKPKPKVLFSPGEFVRVTSGPFNDFSGTVEEVDFERNRLKISLTVFGRPTPVDMEFSQVVKLK